MAFKKGEEAFVIRDTHILCLDFYWGSILSNGEIDSVVAKWMKIVSGK